MTTTILGVAGSLRAGSHNRRLLAAAGELVPADTALVTWEHLAAVPPFDEDDEARPSPVVHALRAAIAAADAVLVVTPEYNASIPGQLKNALDWASRPFPDNALRGKPVAVLGAGPRDPRRAHAEARIVLTRIGARVLERELVVTRSHRQFDAEGRLVDPALRTRLAELLSALVVAAAATPAAVAP